MKTTLQLAGMMFAAALLALPAPARGATIYGNISDVTGTGYATNITFRPITAPLEINQSLYVRADVTNVTTAAGNFTNALVAGDYQLFIGSNPRNTVVIGVPDDNGTYNFTTLIETTLRYPYSSPPSARTTLSGMTDITLANLAHEDVLQYNTNANRWTNRPVTTFGTPQTPYTNNHNGAYYSVGQLESLYIDGRSDGSGGNLSISGGNPTTLNLRNGTDGSTNHGWNLIPYSLGEAAPFASNSLQLLTIGQNQGWQIASNGTLRIVGGGTLGTDGSRISNAFLNGLNLSNGSAFTTAGNALLHDANGNVYSGTVASSGLTNLLLGGTLTVATNASDTTGERNNLAKPYRTLLHAVSNALAGDVIRAQGGTNWFPNDFSTNLAKSGITLDLAPGSTLYATNFPPFEDVDEGAVAVTNFTVTGYADIVWRLNDASISNTLGDNNALLIFTNAGSSVSLNVRDLIAQPQYNAPGNETLVMNKNGARVDISGRDFIMDDTGPDATYIAQWRGDGPMTLRGRHFISRSPNAWGTTGGYGIVWADQTTNSHLYVSGQSLEADFPIYGQSGAAGNQARSWFNIPNIVSTENEAIWNVSAGFLYVTAQKVFSPTDLFRFGAGNNYIWSQKFEVGRSNLNTGFLPLGGGTNKIVVSEIFDTGNTSTGILGSGTGETDFWLLGKWEANPTNNKAFAPIAHNGASHNVRVMSGIYDTRNATNLSAVPVVTAANGLSLGNVVLLVNTNRGTAITNSGANRTIELLGTVRANRGWSDSILWTAPRFTLFAPTNFLDGGTNYTLGVVITNGANSVRLGVTTGGVLTTNGVALAPGGGGSQTPWTAEIDGARNALNNAGSVEIEGATGPAEDASLHLGGTSGVDIDAMRLIKPGGSNLVEVRYTYDDGGPVEALGDLHASAVEATDRVRAGTYRWNGTNSGYKFWGQFDPFSGLYVVNTNENQWHSKGRWLWNASNQVLWITNAITLNHTNQGSFTNTGAFATAGGALLTGGVTNNGSALFNSGVAVGAGQTIGDTARGNFRWSGTGSITWNAQDHIAIRDMWSRSNYAMTVVASNAITTGTLTINSNVHLVTGATITNSQDGYFAAENMGGWLLKSNLNVAGAVKATNGITAIVSAIPTNSAVVWINYRDTNTWFTYTASGPFEIAHTNVLPGRTVKLFITFDGQQNITNWHAFRPLSTLPTAGSNGNRLVVEFDSVTTGTNDIYGAAVFSK